MKSYSTVRRWLREAKAMEVHPNMEVYRQGALMALQCVLQDDWPAPKMFMSLGNKIAVRQGRKAKVIRRMAAQGEK